ncbi:S-adenosylmethionine:tRNA ribosyltransferase-isomerase [Lewinella sp. JB7]|uniref:S-adenosylmethionine:tRNA ribosyltransferase-isomerase n=1 Tax=Lewinella sp. JB7 TaxID=2962887 RepID=UPI0020C9E44F|nr:S-adenosylmethionine:tRNA ribosyltransferase-isomerase [Lewinella sp. JB7]MCP9236719.1 S-adenosylmethionine:tRNA ribosyltransferase-isomerase [Lewinella sp. JB7]
MISDARGLRIQDYDYDLPDERIARHPLPERDGSRLLHYREGQITHGRFRDIPALIPAGSLLIGNQTRVIHARLLFTLPDGRPLEIFCLEPLDPVDYALSLSSPGPVVWKCLVGGNRRWKSGEISLRIDFPGQPLTLHATRGRRRDNAFEITFQWNAPRRMSFGEVIDAAGTIPLPPYLNRAAESADRHRYQTVFARQEGSVAAPTAGLHFTPEVIDRLRERGVNWEALTLHVGAGTFKPVTSPTLGDHVMHREYFSVSLPLLHQLREQLGAGKPIVSIGTTSMRCLESLFYFGATTLEEGEPGEELDQWVASRDRFTRTDAGPAISALIHWMEERRDSAFSRYTQLLLTPAARPRLVDGLITNFHQPRSTLLLLVAAMVGDDWRRVYDYALANDFRFLSYGDSSLLWRNRTGTE